MAPLIPSGASGTETVGGTLGNVLYVPPEQVSEQRHKHHSFLGPHHLCGACGEDLDTCDFSQESPISAQTLSVWSLAMTLTQDSERTESVLDLKRIELN